MWAGHMQEGAEGSEGMHGQRGGYRGGHILWASYSGGIRGSQGRVLSRKTHWEAVK